MFLDDLNEKKRYKAILNAMSSDKYKRYIADQKCRQVNQGKSAFAITEAALIKFKEEFNGSGDMLYPRSMVALQEMRATNTEIKREGRKIRKHDIKLYDVRAKDWELNQEAAWFSC